LDFIKQNNLSKAELMLSTHKSIPNPIFAKDSYDKNYTERLLSKVRSSNKAFEISD